LLKKFYGKDISIASVTGKGVKTSNKKVREDFHSILSAFSPKSKMKIEIPQEEQIDIIVGTDCISEGQNLQDCDTVINFDIQWNPVSLIQRFGRIDRIGSQNEVIQLVNFWPNMELDEYINLIYTSMDSEDDGCCYETTRFNMNVDLPSDFKPEITALAVTDTWLGEERNIEIVK